MLEVGVLVERVEGARLSDRVNENSPSNYSLNVSMAERERNPETLVLSFTLELTNQPQLARLTVSGIASLSGSKDEIQGALAAPDEKTPPAVLTVIYERTYGLLYLIATSLKVAHPLPTLLKTAGSEKK